jgi:hypothetical protein
MVSSIRLTRFTHHSPQICCDIVSGNNQTGVLNAPLPQPFVIVLTANGQPLSQQTANWQVTSGSGTLASASTRTNALVRRRTPSTSGPTATAAVITASALERR